MKFLILLCAWVAATTADVSHLPSEKYLPPSHHHAASEPAASYSVAPATTSYHVEAASAPAVSHSAPDAQSYQIEAASAPSATYESASYQTSASEPAHSYSSDDGYRYKTARRRIYRLRQRRDVSHLSSEYLPPQKTVGSSSSTDNLAPIAAAAIVAQYESAASAPSISYSSHETAASEPAHTFSASEGYRYKTARRRVIRRRRDVSHLTTEYLPPHHGASATSVEYLPPAAASNTVAQYESAPSYSVAAFAPASSYSSYESAASEPAHTYSSAEGYRYKTARRRVIRRRRF